MQTPVPRTHRWLFWLILGAFSTFFAEVFAGSAMFPFFDLWGLAIILPLYGLHVILLATVLFKCGRPSFPGLVFSGMLFGMYEAYLTKVLWQPPWEAPLILAEIAVVEVFVLVFWWHAWFAFITPLLLAEQLTSTRPILNTFNGKLYRFFSSWKGWLALLVFGGVFQSINSPSVLSSLFSGIVNGTVLLLLAWLWKRVTKNSAYTLPDLLPNRREFSFLALWLGAIYLFLGMTVSPDRIPGPVGQGIILMMYLCLIALLITTLRSSRPEPGPASNPDPISPRQLLLLWILFTLTLVLARTFLTGLTGLVILASWAGGSLFGIFMFGKAIRTLVTQKRAGHSTPPTSSAQQL